MTRTIVVDGATFRYKVGQAFTRITGPDGRSRAVDHRRMTGLSWSEIEKGHWKHTFSVTPVEVERVIREQGE